VAKALGGGAATTPAQAGETWGQADAGESFTLATAAGGQRPVLPHLTPCEPFFLSAHPKRFQIQRGTDGRPRLVPALTAWHVEPGRSNVDIAGNKPVVDQALARRARLGWIDVPHDVDGPGTSYLRRVKVKGGVAYITRFESAYPGEESTQRDDDGYLDWVEALVKRGVLPRPSPQTIDRMLGDAATELRNLRKQPDREDVRARIEELKVDVEALKKVSDGDKSRSDRKPVQAEEVT